MSFRAGPTTAESQQRDLLDRVARLERQRGNAGVVSFGGVRVGEWVIEQQGANLVARKADGQGQPITLAAG